MSNTIVEDTILFSKRLVAKTLKDGMLIYENRELPTTIPVNRPFIIRLNASSFKKMNKFLNTTKIDNETRDEFNQSYVLSIIKTTELLLNDFMFKPYLVYTKGDEIILLFNKSYIFDHSVQKYLSILASKATNYFHSCFYGYLTNENNVNLIKKYSGKTIQKILNASPVFKSRLVFFPEDKNYEIVNYFMWRNTQINSLQECLQSLYTNKICFKQTNQKLSELFKDNSYFNQNSYLNIYMTYGIFMKKSLISTNINEKIISHHQTHMWSMIFKYNDEILKQMLTKYYDEDKWISICKSYTKIWQIYEPSMFSKSNTDNDTYDYMNDSDADDYMNTDENDIDTANTANTANESDIENNEDINFPIAYKFIPLLVVLFSFLNHLQSKSHFQLDNKLICQSCMSVIYCCIMKCIFVQYNFTFNFMCNFDKLCYVWFFYVGIISLLSIITNNFLNVFYILLFILITLQFSFMIIYSVSGYVEIIDYINDCNLQKLISNQEKEEELNENDENNENDDEVFEKEIETPGLIDSYTDDSSDIDAELEIMAENIQKENLHLHSD